MAEGSFCSGEGGGLDAHGRFGDLDHWPWLRSTEQEGFDFGSRVRAHLIGERARKPKNAHCREYFSETLTKSVLGC